MLCFSVCVLQSTKYNTSSTANCNAGAAAQVVRRILRQVYYVAGNAFVEELSYGDSDVLLLLLLLYLYINSADGTYHTSCCTLARLRTLSTVIVCAVMLHGRGTVFA